jgi:hypothetical protein
VTAFRESELKHLLRSLLASVVKEASAHGLKCEELPVGGPGTRQFRRRLLIEGRKCQLILSKVQHVRGSTSVLAIYPAPLPRTQWADFLLYVIRDDGHPGNVSFFVVPRGDTVKRTTVCSADNWFFQYKDAWSLLTESLSGERFERNTELFNWKMSFTMNRAKSLGFDVKLADNNRKGHLQNRLLINGRKCQLIALARKHSDYIAFQVPKQDWAEFLIFLNAENLPTFIFPRERIHRTISTSLRAGWLSGYQDNWELLRAR